MLPKTWSKGVSTMAKVKKKIKSIRIVADKCTGCRACETICSAFHATPRYSSNNPARSRIRIVREPLRDIEYTMSECTGRNIYTIDGKEYRECDLCRASCPSRDLFKEPDSGLPLKCDMCEDTPPLAVPKCVEWCLAEALIYEEREEEVEEEPALADIEISVEALIDKYGLQHVLDSVARRAKS